MKIITLIDDGYEDSEYEKPAAAFREAGHELVLAGLEKGAELHGKGGTSTVTVERGIDEIRPDEVEALFLPGGYSPDHLRIDEHAVEITRSAVESGKPVFAICHGPQLLLTGRVVEGRRLTAWPTVQRDLELAGAEVTDEEVVVDGSLVTSRKPDDIPAFSKAALEVLERVPAGR